LFRRRAESPETLILFGFLIGLGFGVSEFLIYVFLAKVPVLVRLPGLFFHGASTAIATMGLVKNNISKYYLIAVILHSIVNLFAELGKVYIIGGLGSVILTYILSYNFYRVAED